MTARRQPLADDLAAATSSVYEVETLAHTAFRSIAARVPFVFACLATTDPATGVIARAIKSSPLPMGSEEFAAVEYGASDINQFAEIAQRPVPAAALWLDTDGHSERCRRMREFLTPKFGFTDELRLVCRSRGTMWAVLALYRGRDESPFTHDEVDQLPAAGEVIAERVQRALFAGDAADSAVDAPAVVLVDGANRVTQMTATAPAQLADLGGADDGALPDNVLAVAVLARVRNGSAATRVRGRSGRWLLLRAMTLDGPAAPRSVVITIDVAGPAAVGQLALAACGLTAREHDVAKLVLQGASTKDIAASLHLSPHTVQDHLKAVFRKLDVTSRRELTARLVVPNL